MTKEEHIIYWTEQAADDWEAVNTLFKGKKYLQSLFFAHLVIEKLGKALWIKNNKTNIPPKTHNLNYILSQTGIDLSESQSEFLLQLNRFQLEGRYPDYLKVIKKICTESFANNIIEQTDKVKQWLIQHLQ